MIPVLDLQAQINALRPELDAAVAAVLDGGQFILGPHVESFERRFAEYCATPHAVAVNSGTASLYMALVAAGIGRGDEVITVPMTFIATAAAIELAGAKPVFVDIDPGRWTMDPARIEAAITPRTKALLPVHLYGQMADMDEIMAIARIHQLVVIEDACQAHGAELAGRRAGSLGHMGCFSFYPGKNLGALGEGGAVVTTSDELAKRLRMLRNWGQDGKYNHVLKGLNARMDGIQGAVLSVKMNYIEAWTEARQARAALYDRLLADLPVRLPSVPANARHARHCYSLCVDDRDRVCERLEADGIATAIHYPIPLHLQPAYADLGYAKGDFPVAEALAATTLSLPLYPELSEADVREVANSLARAFIRA